MSNTFSCKSFASISTCVVRMICTNIDFQTTSQFRLNLGQCYLGQLSLDMPRRPIMLIKIRIVKIIIIQLLLQFSLWASSRAILVVFWKAEDPQMCTFGVLGNTFVQNRRQFHPRHFHPKTVSSSDTFIQKWFRPVTLSSKTGFIQ